MDSATPLRIGCASAFWGDTNTAAQQLVHSEKIDVLVFDYLAEVTLSIMAGQRLKDPSLGYAKDFVKHTMPPLLDKIAAQKLKVISNAGGLNPQACAQALIAEIEQQNLTLKVAVVEGDNIMSAWRTLKAQCHPFPDDTPDQASPDQVTGDKNSPWPPTIMTNNVYLGAAPIKAALDAGADIVITGRIVDSALTLAPLLHHFQWSMDDYDKLAQGSLAGHVIECGTQCTGGNFTDWHRIRAWKNVGFPIVNCFADGHFTVTKAPDTDGLVDPDTVAEQITYEIGNPACYQLPDVTCDFSAVTVNSVGPDEVCVQGATGSAPSQWLKFSATYMDGFRCTAYCVLAGPEAVRKAEITVESLLAKINQNLTQQGKKPIENVDIELLGSEAQYGKRAARRDTREVVIKFACQHDDKKALVYFSQEIAQASTGMTPGFTTLLGGRPTVYPVARLYSGLIPKDQVSAQFILGDDTTPIRHDLNNGAHNNTNNSKNSQADSPKTFSQEQSPELAPEASLGAYAHLKFSVWLAEHKNMGQTARAQAPHTAEQEAVPLGLLALTRSGDKGNHANIGVIARQASYLPILKATLTPAAIAEYFSHLFDPTHGEILCYYWPGLNALNLVLKHCLGNGGIASLRSDPQGKAFGQQLLDFPIPVTDTLAALLPEDRRPPYVCHN